MTLAGRNDDDANVHFGTCVVANLGKKGQPGRKAERTARRMELSAGGHDMSRHPGIEAVLTLERPQRMPHRFEDRFHTLRRSFLNFDAHRTTIKECGTRI